MKYDIIDHTEITEENSGYITNLEPHMKVTRAAVAELLVLTLHR